MLGFHSRLMSTVGLIVEIKLHFQIYPSQCICGQSVRIVIMAGLNVLFYGA